MELLAEEGQINAMKFFHLGVGPSGSLPHTPKGFKGPPRRPSGGPGGSLGLKGLSVIEGCPGCPKKKERKKQSEPIPTRIYKGFLFERRNFLCVNKANAVAKDFYPFR